MVPQIDYDIRPAAPVDIPDLSKLLILAADGIIDAIYRDLIPGKPINEIVERRFRRRGMTSSYEKCWVAVHDDRVVGKLHAYPLDDGENDVPDELIPDERFAVIEPFDRLDPSATGTFYVNVVAVYPEFQGQGIGRSLLALARTQARERAFNRLSLVVFEKNHGAIRLYRRFGFQEVARHPAARHELIHMTGDMLMMISEV